MEMIYDENLLEYLRELSKKQTSDRLNHVMKSKKDYIFYYYRKKENGGNYTIKLPVKTIAVGYSIFLESKQVMN